MTIDEKAAYINSLTPVQLLAEQKNTTEFFMSLSDKDKVDFLCKTADAWPHEYKACCRPRFVNFVSEAMRTYVLERQELFKQLLEERKKCPADSEPT
jgi:hypothetical protein